MSKADALAARISSSEQLADSLVRRALQDRFLDQNFWPDLWKSANQQPQPPTDVFDRLAGALCVSPDNGSLKRWLGESLAVPTTNADTHPCLADRLQAMDQLKRIQDGSRLEELFAAPKISATEVLLQPSFKETRSKVQALWVKETSEAWRARFARAGALSQRLTALEQALPASATDIESQWDKAALLLDLKKDDEAETLLRRILSLRPDYIRANYHLGRLLLAHGLDEGEACLERAIAEDPELLPQACAMMREHYRRTGRPERLRAIDLRLDQYEKDLAASVAERREVSARDPLIPHGLTPTELQELQKVLGCEPGLERAELGRKELRHFPNQKLFLLCVRPLRRWGLLAGVNPEMLVEHITRTVRLPGRVLVFAPAGGFRSLARRLRRIDGALVFPRTQRDG